MSFFRKIFKGSQRNSGADTSGNGRQFSLVANPPRAKEAQVWAVGGGKGGVGKSLLTVNLGVLLCRKGKKVLLIDADLGAANLHTLTGVDGSKTSLSSFLKGEVHDLRQTLIKTRIPELDLISGANDSLDVADIKTEGITRLRSAIRGLEYDYVLLDIGPGTSANMLDLFLMADEGIMVCTPEPTSVENTYRFLKCLFLRRIKNIMNSHENGQFRGLLVRMFSGNWSEKIKTVSDIIAGLKAAAPQEGDLFQNLMGKTQVSFIINKVKKPEDSQIGPVMETACRGYFGIRVVHLGDVTEDDTVGESICAKMPLLFENPRAKAATEIEACFRRLLARRPADDARQMLSV